MDSENTAAWYEDWFDSPYYSILYQNRDETEARQFIDALLATLQPSTAARVLDLACGKGRFSKYLAEKGFDVTGLDLSFNSIQYARQFEAGNLAFYTHDMRLPYRMRYYDYIFSFFTSFGYFDTDRDHIRTLKSIRTGLRAGGIFVLDFFNACYVRKGLPMQEEKELEGIRFQISKTEDGRFVTKSIQFEDAGRAYRFEERVRLYEQPDLERLFHAAGLEITDVYGDYTLQSFDLQSSPRIILVARATV
ncbi:MAG TPA: methyltransferase domain-containing protein [Saprospiraceae bacterium]|nr:methyltransferase domain-containing protein [Saprospiraceae bacterium]